MKQPLVYKDKLKVERKKRLFFKITFIFLFTASLFGLLVYLLFFAGLFDVQDVVISGNSTVSSQDVLKIVNNSLSEKKFSLPVKLNIFLLNADKINGAILAFFPRFKSAVTDKDLFHRINIIISERDPVGIWCVKKINQCAYFDKEGIALEVSSESYGSIFLHIDDYKGEKISAGDEIAKKDWVEKIIQSKDELEKQLNIKIKSAFIAEGAFDEFGIITVDGWKLLLAKNLDIPFQIESLKIFMTQKLTPEKLKSLRYIDARIENRFYYK